jgi:sigma-E factor negative regulatory protein RseB
MSVLCSAGSRDRVDVDAAMGVSPRPLRMAGRLARLPRPAALALLAVSWLAVVSGASAEPVLVKSAEAPAILERIKLASLQRSFSGTLVYTAADVMSSSRVARYGSGDAVVERIEVLDGHQQRSYRQNDAVHTIWPSQRLVTVERRSVVDEAVGLTPLDPRLLASYELRHLGEDRIVGRNAAVFLLKPRDESRFAQRVWADSASGLLLRADVLSPQGQVLESTAFTSLELDVRMARDPQSALAARRTEGYRTVTLTTEKSSLEAEGWTADRLPPGFRLIGCVQRSLADPTDAANGKSSTALQAVFSDGLARVSVFIETHDPAKPRTPLMTHLGATHTLMKPFANRWWLTVMGDVPLSTLKAFAEGLSRKS